MSKKAVVLTYAPITDEEAKLLRNTEIFKIACNDYRAELKPNVRLTMDDIVQKCLDCDTCPVVSCGYDFDLDERVISGITQPNRNSSVPACVDYLIMHGYRHILLVATNTVSGNKQIAEKFQEYNRRSINELNDCAYIYKYSQDGVFDIPYLSIKEFLNMTDDELILGCTEAAPKKRLLEVVAFGVDMKYRVCNDQGGAVSVENGETIKNILPMEEKERILAGAKRLEWNGLIIEVESTCEEVVEVKKPVVKKTTKKKVVK